MTAWISLSSFLRQKLVPQISIQQQDNTTASRIESVRLIWLAESTADWFFL
jgi:hypothetical protein